MIPLLSSLGLLLFAQAESLFPNRIFMGFCLGMVIFAGAAGLNELLMSPIVDTISADEDREWFRLRTGNRGKGGQASVSSLKPLLLAKKENL